MFIIRGWCERKLWCWGIIIGRQGGKNEDILLMSDTELCQLMGLLLQNESFNPFYFQINCDSSLSIIVQQPT